MAAQVMTTETYTASLGPMLLLTMVLLAIYLGSPVIQSGDGRLVLYEANSVLTEQNLDLHEYGPIVQGFPCYREGERILSRYPYGTSLMTVPLLAVVRGVGALAGHDPAARLRDETPRALEKGLASVLAALAVLTLMLMAREMLGRTAPALLLGGIFALGTALWSTASRGLWQHGPLVMLLALGLLFLSRGLRLTDQRRWPALAGAALAAGYVVRPTAAIPLGLAGVGLLVTRRTALLPFLTGAALVLVPSVTYNLWVYGQMAIPFYSSNGGFLSGGVRASFPEGLAGTMVSPARGLLIFSPFLALAAAGAWMRRRQLGILELVAIGSPLAIWVLASNTRDWAGGWSYGPRLLADALPFLALLMLPVMDAVTRPRSGWSAATTTLAATLALTVAWSVFVQARGALSWSTQIWNVRPVGAGVESHPERFWDWSDPQFLRGGRTTLKDIYPHSTPGNVPPDQVCLQA